VLRRRVLVVDDEERLGAVFERMIGDEHDVVFLGEGRAAKDLLDRGEDFDVVFLDLMMPDVSGMDLYAHLEATRPSMIPKVVIMTGGAYTRSARELVDRLATPPLPKPIDWNALRDWIAALPT
jgi:DNA-binding NtrC family response regulator